MRSGLIRLCSALALGAALFVLGPAPASAQLEACGNIHVEADAMCAIEVMGGCTAMCEPINFTASCSADLYVECSGMCNATVDVDCMASCDISACMASCEVDPGGFDCEAECTADLSVRCSTECEAEAAGSQARAECEASCESTFTAECRASCDARPPSADCMASCMATCEGRCTGEANVDCQVMCQSGGYIDCTSMLTGGCETQCMEPDGALFCDGQYVDHGGNLDACIMALQEALAIEVDVSARGSSSCMGGMCMAEGEVSASCGVSGVPRSGGASGWLGLLIVPVGAVFGAIRRRRRRVS